jgi:hypothetical protein
MYSLSRKREPVPNPLLRGGELDGICRCVACGDLEAGWDGVGAGDPIDGGSANSRSLHFAGDIP